MIFSLERVTSHVVLVAFFSLLVPYFYEMTDKRVLVVLARTYSLLLGIELARSNELRAFLQVENTLRNYLQECDDRRINVNCGLRKHGKGEKITES